MKATAVWGGFDLGVGVGVQRARGCAADASVQGAGKKSGRGVPARVATRSGLWRERRGLTGLPL
eukprot:CAMPEP_0119313152 /NCGR_PEP_ID=MMETSP1333-20130426/28069_1 /TAXON_ID=418940 /ORGANISM="Scyphosphaera apsteinii, Strain RCC1455" /LENGTH=63 /DNA_ID=CAMNT_0007317911 /DNA_START=197 /DNA_END=388 /DNA_ORIENTATION=-